MAANGFSRSTRARPTPKRLLVDREGRIVYRASAPLEILQPQPGFVEQDPLALWQSVVQVIAACVRHAQAETRIDRRHCHQQSARDRCRVAAGGAGSAAAGEPVGNAITWQCRRSAPVCERLRAHAATIQSIDGLPLDPLLSATKWAWLFDRQPELRGAGRSAASCISAQSMRGCFTT